MKNWQYGVFFGAALFFYGAPVQAFGSVKDALYAAAKRGDAVTIESYLQQGYSIDTTDGSGMSALCTAHAEGNMAAYNLLLQYGANSYAGCMYAPAKEGASGFRLSSNMPYILAGTAAVAIGAAVAAAGGHGGGGSSSSDNAASNADTGSGDSENLDFGGTYVIGFPEDNSSKTNSEYNVGEVSDESTASAIWSGSDASEYSGYVSTPYTKDNYQAKNEYKFRTAEVYGPMLTAPVNYLGAINASDAYIKFTGNSSDGKFATDLKPISVGVIDTGVWYNHTEFMMTDAFGQKHSKVSGYNFDYGPCRNGDKTHCYAVISEGTNLGSLSGWLSLITGSKKAKAIFYTTNGDYQVIDNNVTQEEMAKYVAWASFYDADYDWDARRYNVEPNSGKVHNEDGSVDTSKFNTSFLHGTNVAGIIAANMDGFGTMGVAFSNARIKAVRWDFLSDMAAPMLALVNDENNVRVINLSMGQENISETNNASTLVHEGQISADYRTGISAIINKNRNSPSSQPNDIAVVRAAGNHSISNPDLESGIKLLEAYKEVPMLIVAAADVTVDTAGNLVNYKISDYSNRCGVTGSYCITAPGGSFSGNTLIRGMYGPGEPGHLNYEYYATGGTSQATPVVSGALAFILGAYPYMSAAQAVDLLMTTANKTKAVDYANYDEAGFKSVYGAGLIDLGRAVQYVSDTPGTYSISSFSGTSVQGPRVSLDGAQLNVPAGLQNAFRRALPATITVFDRYNRPFDFDTANYVRNTHGGYNALKNDVANIAMPHRVQTKKDGNFSFAFASGSLRKGGAGMGLMDMRYKQDKSEYGFYFSENTIYKSADGRSAALKNPFMAFNEAYGVHHTYNFSKNAALRIEAVTGRNGLYDGSDDYRDRSFEKQAYGFNAELNLHKSKKFAFGVSSGVLYEKDAMLGTNGEGAFGLNGGNTYTVGVTASWFATPKWTLSGSYYRGYTKAQSFNSDMLNTSDLVSSSFALDANYQADKTTDYGLRLSSPLRVEKGTLSVDFPCGRDNFSDEVYRQTYQAGMKPERREYRLMAYFNKDLSDNISLRSEVGVRFNPEHENAANDYRALFGLSWNFN